MNKIITIDQEKMKKVLNNFSENFSTIYKLISDIEEHGELKGCSDNYKYALAISSTISLFIAWRNTMSLLFAYKIDENCKKNYESARVHLLGLIKKLEKDTGKKVPFEDYDY